MLDLRPVAIAGGNDVFSSGVNNFFGAARPALGQTQGQAIYQNAKAQVQRFDSLVDRTKKIANKSVRDQIGAEFGLTDPADKDKALYMRNAVAGNIAEAESFKPTNYYVFEAPGPAKGRPAKLQDFDNDFQRRVEEAEATWGTLPAPQVIERIVQVPGAAAPMSPLVPVVVVGALAVAGLALLGVFGGK